MEYEYCGKSLYETRSGPEVRQLQEVLRFLGYDIPKEEYDRMFFGAQTKNAVVKIQTAYKVPGNLGIVDQQTVKYIKMELAAMQPQPEYFVVLGGVNYKNGPVAMGLTIRAFDIYQSIKRQLGKDAISRDDGTYRIEYPTSDLINPTQKKPNLHVVAYRGVVEETSADKKSDADSSIATVPLVIPRDAPLPEKLFFKITGRVTRGGSPVEGLTVIAYDFDSQESRAVGNETKTDGDGRYGIEYPTDQLIKPEERHPNLRVKASKDKKVVAETERLSANPEEIINLEIKEDDKEPFTVTGRVKRADGNPLSGAAVKAIHEGSAGAIALGEDTTKADGRYLISYNMPLGETSINLRVTASADGKLGQSDVIHNARHNEIVDLTVPSSGAEISFQVEGRVISQFSAGVGGLRVSIMDRGVGGDVKLAEAITDSAGAYCATFGDADLQKRGKALPDIQARVFSGENFLGTSDIRYNASNHETLNILLDEKATSNLMSEHETLTLALSSHFKGRLSDLKETDEQQDITYLANKSGWDARAVALASLADQFSARTVEARREAGIEPAFFYALFRAGLPANESALYQADAKVAEGIWKQAIAQGTISKALESRIPSAVEQFQSLAAEKALDSPALIGVSSLKEMISISLGDDEKRQKQFSDIYTRNKNDSPKFWQDVKTAFGDDAESRLRIDGKLAYLTFNNAPLMRKLHADCGENGISDAIELVERGYYRKKPWQEIISDVTIPKEIPGESDTEKREHYAELMAAQLRLSFPNAAIAQMVKKGETQLLDKDKQLADSVHSFLMNPQGTFEIGRQPIEQYAVMNNLPIEPTVRKEITRIQRVYQITPSDDAMNALLKKGVDSAYAVTKYGRDEFVQAFSEVVGGEANAQLIHAKSQQVHNAALNVAVSYLSARNAPGIGKHGASAQILDPSLLAYDPTYISNIIAYPTLEGLFGEMDYCTCEHCRSILSPAAYLVDLLKFIDRPSTPSTESTQRKDNPLDVLLERRPDIQYLPLTCENTNTPIPYIDLVNEVLEYYITNKLSLTNFTGHTTDGTAMPEELLANPQFVSDKAYEILEGNAILDVKPANASDALPLLPPTPPLPFNRPLENLRRYFDKFEAPLPEIMEDLRKGDNLERTNDDEYGWRDIMMEELLLSRSEYRLLTDRNVTLQQLYGYSPGTSELDVLVRLSNAKAFARRVGVSYEELIEILKTRFINSNCILIPKLERLGYSYQIPKLERLGLSFKTIQDLKEGKITEAQFEALLPDGIDKALYDGNVSKWVLTNYDRIAKSTGVTFQAIKDFKNGTLSKAAFRELVPIKEIDITLFGGKAGQSEEENLKQIEKWVLDNYEQIMGLILLTPTKGSDVCSFDNLEFRYSNADNKLSAFDFVRLIRFIRLWKKLGWTMDLVDKTITALYPINQVQDNSDAMQIKMQKLDDGFRVLLLRLGVAKRLMDALTLRPKDDLLPLLACFAPIDTNGDGTLYSQMFLSQVMQKQDEAFADNGYGQFLTDDAVKLMDHEESLRSAFQLTGDEFGQITARLGFDGETPLGHRTTDKEMTELLGHPPNNEQNKLLTERMRTQNISAVFRRGWLARKLKLSIKEFLLLTQFTGLDPFAAPDQANPSVLRLIDMVDRLRLASLKPTQALYLIWDQDISGKSAPDNDEIWNFARTLRSDFTAIETEFNLTDDPDGQVARARMALVYGNDITDLFFGLLDNTLVTDVPYDHRQATLEKSITDVAPKLIAYDDFRKRLSFKGVLTEDIRNGLKAVVRVTADFKNAVDSLYANNRKVIEPFFDRYPKLRPLYNDYTASKDPIEKRRYDLLAGLLPDLKDRRKRQNALQTISATAKTEVVFADTLLAPKPDNKFVLHAAVDAEKPAIDDLVASSAAGLSAQFFFRDTATGNVDRWSDAESNLDYAATGRNKLPANLVPKNAISGIWSGYLEAPESGPYNLRIEADAGANVKLELDGATRDLKASGNIWSTKPIELRAGTLYRISLTVEKVKDRLSVCWETIERHWEVIPPRYLYSSKQLENLRQDYIRFLKAASLAMALKLTAVEIAYLSSQVAYQTDSQDQLDIIGWLNVLPINGSPGGAISKKLLMALTALLDFARLKADLAPNDERFLTVLKNPSAMMQNSESLLFSLTRWDSGSLDSLLLRFGKVKNGKADLEALHNLAIFCRICDAYAWVKKLGIPASAMIKATTNEPTAIVVRDLQAALRARYDQSGWLGVLKPINDEMRRLQRDALVAYILHQMRENPNRAHIDTPEKLFEFFLMDVEMEPCMQTSRIRHALSSVQLFIERCLMNLEQERVSPSSIIAQQWEWMKRYRIWEANRKVFLYPENWLEPELRDDQSPFFKEAMSELLQGDITEDRAATVLLNYLSKLEEVAKLEPCGIYYIEDDPKTKDRREDVSHVVARTSGANRKYYYRRREIGNWTPWEQIKLDIEDDPVIPVVWQSRLLLFWLRILKEMPLDPSKMISSTGPKKDGKDLNLASISLSQIKQDARETKNSKAVIRAILCWSEHYNGKWQPTKTSDINKPAKLGEIDVSETFDRSELMLGVSEEGTALRILINSANSLQPSFLLYNTHSSPELDAPSEFVVDFISNRRLNCESSTLSVIYDHIPRVFSVKEIFHMDNDEFMAWLAAQGDSLRRSILRYIIKLHVVEPRHTSLQNVWLSPFFLWDSRHVFYVNTSKDIEKVSEWSGFHIPFTLDDGFKSIPGIIIKYAQLPESIQDPYGPITRIPGFGVINPSPIEHLISEDAYISRGIGTIGTVRFGNKEIGLTGSLNPAKQE